jgi:hypothetical protein
MSTRGAATKLAAAAVDDRRAEVGAWLADAAPTEVQALERVVDDLGGAGRIVDDAQCQADHRITLGLVQRLEDGGDDFGGWTTDRLCGR